MKKSLIIGIILIIISLGIVIYNELVNKPVNIYSITNTGSKKENVKVYLDATFIAGSVTSDSENGYYVIFGDGVQYIVYMNNKEASRINNYLMDNEEKSYHIIGTTKLIPSEMEENGKKFVKEWLDNNHNHEEVTDHSHDITTDDFYHYFGYVYMDANNGFNIVNIIFYLTGILGILFIVNYLNTKYHLI